jgi:pilus assembly protein CpaF
MIPREVFEESLLQFLDPVRKYLLDPTVSEVMINGPDQVFIERRGRIEHTDARFASEAAVLTALRNAAQFVGKYLDDQNPILEARLPDGSRVQGVIKPVATTGPYMAIRRFFQASLTVDRLIESGSLTTASAALLNAMVSSKLNVLVAGGTGSGKTSLLNLLTSFVPHNERVCVIEDTLEVQVQHPHVFQMEARRADDEAGIAAVTIRDLFRASLRMRPDRIIIGEIRGGEALDIIQAMVSGHGGCLCTLHASHPRDTLTRLETMAMMSDIAMPLAALRQQIASGVNAVVQVTRLNDGQRLVTHITEITGHDGHSGGYLLQDIFARRYSGVGRDGRVHSALEATGAVPTFEQHLREHGQTLPDELYAAARALPAKDLQ